MTQQLAREDVEAAFGELGGFAGARKAAEVAFYEGPAILLQFRASFRTGDVHATVETGDHGALMQAVHDIAERRGWLRSWFSEAITICLDDSSGTQFDRKYPSETRIVLRGT